MAGFIQRGWLGDLKDIFQVSHVTGWEWQAGSTYESSQTVAMCRPSCEKDIPLTYDPLAPPAKIAEGVGYMCLKRQQIHINILQTSYLSYALQTHLILAISITCQQAIYCYL